MCRIPQQTATSTDNFFSITQVTGIEIGGQGGHLPPTFRGGGYYSLPPPPNSNSEKILPKHIFANFYHTLFRNSCNTMATSKRLTLLPSAMFIVIWCKGGLDLQHFSEGGLDLWRCSEEGAEIISEQASEHL